MILSYLAIGLGGALGSITRAMLAKIFPTTFFNIPIPILIVNILGCFLIGLLTKFFSEVSADGQMLKLFLTTGFLGGFTTFSTFALEFGLLFEKNLYFPAIIYMIASVSLSLIAFFIGLRIA